MSVSNWITLLLMFTIPMLIVLFCLGCAAMFLRFIDKRENDNQDQTFRRLTELTRIPNSTATIRIVSGDDDEKKKRDNDIIDPLVGQGRHLYEN